TAVITVGIIEGIAEATASIVTVFSGALSDRIGKRKLLASVGYRLAALTEPVFPLAPSVGWLSAARLVDRLSKGTRGALRDVLVAALSLSILRGASYRLRQSLDAFGAFLGPLAAIALMWVTADHFVSVFWIAFIPAFVSFALVLVAVRDPGRPAELRAPRMPLSRGELGRLDRAYWWVVAVSAPCSLG